MTFTSVILICALSMPKQACNETSALDSISIVVANEIGCLHGQQEAVARSGLRDMEGVYLKTLCRRGL